MLRKLAYIAAITAFMEKKGVHFIHFDESSYGSKQDMVHFTSDGHRCILLGMGVPDKKGTIPMKVEWKHDIWDVALPPKSLSLGAIQRIAYEAYDWIKDPEDEDWMIIEESIKQILDSDENK